MLGQIRQAAYCFGTRSWGQASGLGWDSGSCMTGEHVANPAVDKKLATCDIPQQAFQVPILHDHLEPDRSDMAKQ